MAVDLDKLRRFAGADPDESPGLLEDCWNAAVDWYEKAGVPADTAGALYDYWVMNLAAWYYDNRGADDSLIPQNIVNSVHQLRPVSAERRVSRRGH